MLVSIYVRVLNIPCFSMYQVLNSKVTQGLLAELVPLPYSWRRSISYSDRLHDFSKPFLDVTRISMSAVSFLTMLD